MWNKILYIGDSKSVGSVITHPFFEVLRAKNIREKVTKISSMRQMLDKFFEPAILSKQITSLRFYLDRNLAK